MKASLGSFYRLPNNGRPRALATPHPPPGDERPLMDDANRLTAEVVLLRDQREAVSAIWSRDRGRASSSDLLADSKRKEFQFHFSGIWSILQLPGHPSATGLGLSRFQSGFPQIVLLLHF